MQLVIKFFQLSADWILLTFTIVQAINELRSYKKELASVESHTGKLHIDSKRWWIIFPYKLHLEKKEIHATLQKQISEKDIKKINRSRSFLYRAEAWLYIVLGSSFYLVSTTIDILTSLTSASLSVIIVTPLLFVCSSLFVVSKFVDR